MIGPRKASARSSNIQPEPAIAGGRGAFLLCGGAPPWPEAVLLIGGLIATISLVLVLRARGLRETRERLGEHSE